MAKFGFYEYDTAVVGSDGVICKEDLTSLPAAGSEVGAGTHVYSDAGFTGAVNTGIQISGLTDQSLLNIEGTVRIMVSKEAFDCDDVLGVNANFFAFQDGTTMTLGRSTGTPEYLRCTCGSALDSKSFATDMRMYFSSHSWGTVDGLVEIFFTWDQFGMALFLDRLKVMDVSWVDSSTRPSFTKFFINAISGSGGTYTYKNLLIATKRINLPSTRAVSRIVFYGDSYTKLGNYPQCDTSGRQAMCYFSSSDEALATSYTEDGKNGDNFDASVASSASGRRDSAFIPALHRLLNKQNLFPDQIYFWGEGGSGYETAGPTTGTDIPARIDESLVGYVPPNIAIFVAGYNDAANGGITAGYQAAIEGCISALKAANPDVKIIITTLPYNTNALYLTGEADPLAQCQAVNTVIETVASADSAVTLVDMFTAFGGATNDGTVNFHTDFIHPSAAGYAIYAREINSAIRGLL